MPAKPPTTRNFCATGALEAVAIEVVVTGWAWVVLAHTQTPRHAMRSTRKHPMNCKASIAEPFQTKALLYL
jgi:hypothetical protein